MCCHTLHTANTCTCMHRLTHRHRAIILLSPQHGRHLVLVHSCPSSLVFIEIGLRASEITGWGKILLNKEPHCTPPNKKIESHRVGGKSAEKERKSVLCVDVKGWYIGLIACDVFRFMFFFSVEFETYLCNGIGRFLSA